MKTYSNHIFRFFVLLLIFLFFSCKDNAPNAPELYEYSIPELTNDGWQTADIHDYDINLDYLIELSDQISFGFIKNIHSLLIVKKGKLIFENYWSGNKFDPSFTDFQGMYITFTKDILHNQASVTKSITSTLVGIAIDKGYISSIQNKVYDYFPEYSDLNQGSKKNMTIEHLLTMTSGYEWNEGELPYSNSNNDLIQMWYVSDPLRYIMAKPLTAEPGTSFYYNSGCTNILGEIVHRATGESADRFADAFLFQPLGITKYSWKRFNNDVLFASGDLTLLPRDMAKIGYLFLNNGLWDGKRIVSSEWTEASTDEHITVLQNLGYGFQWWTEKYFYQEKEIDAFSARGWGGQRILVFRDLDIVVVLTGGNYQNYQPINSVIQNAILPAIL